LLNSVPETTDPSGEPAVSRGMPSDPDEPFALAALTACHDQNGRPLMRHMTLEAVVGRKRNRQLAHEMKTEENGRMMAGDETYAP
jgi:hypothetical protein